MPIFLLQLCLLLFFAWCEAKGPQKRGSSVISAEQFATLPKPTSTKSSNSKIQHSSKLNSQTIIPSVKSKPPLASHSPQHPSVKANNKTVPKPPSTQSYPTVAKPASGLPSQQTLHKPKAPKSASNPPPLQQRGVASKRKNPKSQSPPTTASKQSSSRPLSNERKQPSTSALQPAAQKLVQNKDPLLREMIIRGVCIALGAIPRFKKGMLKRLFSPKNERYAAKSAQGQNDNNAAMAESLQFANNMAPLLLSSSWKDNGGKKFVSSIVQKLNGEKWINTKHVFRRILSNLPAGLQELFLLKPKAPNKPIRYAIIPEYPQIENIFEAFEEEPGTRLAPKILPISCVFGKNHFGKVPLSETITLPVALQSKTKIKQAKVYYQYRLASVLWFSIDEGTLTILMYGRDAKSKAVARHKIQLDLSRKDAKIVALTEDEANQLLSLNHARLFFYQRIRESKIAPFISARTGWGLLDKSINTIGQWINKATNRVSILYSIFSQLKSSTKAITVATLISVTLLTLFGVFGGQIFDVTGFLERLSSNISWDSLSDTPLVNFYNMLPNERCELIAGTLTYIYQTSNQFVLAVMKTFATVFPIMISSIFSGLLAVKNYGLGFDGWISKSIDLAIAPLEYAANCNQHHAVFDYFPSLYNLVASPVTTVTETAYNYWYPSQKSSFACTALDMFRR